MRNVQIMHLIFIYFPFCWGNNMGHEWIWIIVIIFTVYQKCSLKLENIKKYSQNNSFFVEAVIPLHVVTVSVWSTSRGCHSSSDGSNVLIGLGDSNLFSSNKLLVSSFSSDCCLVAFSVGFLGILNFSLSFNLCKHASPLIQL